MAITYERDTDGTYIAVVEDGTEARRGYEVAAWYDRLVLEGGRYPLRKSSISGILTAAIPARLIEQHTPSLFGGVPTGGGAINAPKDEPTTYARTDEERVADEDAAADARDDEAAR
jgi:hypothetical protein